MDVGTAVQAFRKAAEDLRQRPHSWFDYDSQHELIRRIHRGWYFGSVCEYDW